MNLYKLIRPLLFSLDAEKAHDLVFGCRNAFKIGPTVAKLILTLGSRPH